MKELTKKYKITAILRGMETERAVRYVSALYEGGLRLFEVALNTKDALNQIERLCAEFPGAIIGAGTVLTPSLASDAVSAGAKFLLSPSTNPEVLEYCASQKIKILPGVLTPTDVSVCLSYGISTMKLFPAGDMPKSYVKSLRGPFDGTEYVAVGGISPENTPEYLKAGYIGVGIGSSLVPKGISDEKIPEYIKTSLERIGV
ncbi:MAG: bifunctional 4-hydroxy-2-oxoglutarate aldolase/2-dehydro-3-deoxy-phosphogluconate aldolase [Clostridiales bacterium]|nr:bifunctional 4-hydroxy-2-oxoglutarate aldolase/2-dehydro-3-deoxy-phosphogluconate aldolase [Clostridiales bacterium]